jgi:hypothetical protein
MNSTEYSAAIRLIEEHNWEAAHAIVQNIETKEAALIHAYLHKVEGDIGNATYWYRRAGTSPFAGSQAEELEMLKQKFLDSEHDQK